MADNFDLVEVDCPVCGSHRSKILFETMDYQFGVTNQIFLVKRCLECGAGYLSPRPKEHDIGNFYNPDFYWSHEGGKKQDAEGLLEKRRQQLDNKYAILAKLRPGTLLDIGTQKGEFTHYMCQKGWQAEGVEFSEMPERMFDVKIRYGDFLDLEYVDSSFDCVTMWAVLEHVYRPAEYVEKIGRILNEGGTFVGVATNMNSIQSRVYGKDDYPRHLTIFTSHSLRKLLQESGFEVQKIWTDQKLFGGSLRGGITYMVKRLRGYNRHDLLKEWNDRSDPTAFSTKFRGKPSLVTRVIAKLDKIALSTLEKILDKMGFGQILLWVAIKR